jgi:hypothetical protein
MSSKHLKVSHDSSGSGLSSLRLRLQIDAPCTILAQKVDLDVDEAFNVAEDFCSYFSVEKVQSSDKDVIVMIKKKYQTAENGNAFVNAVDEDVGSDEGSENSVSIGLIAVGSSLSIILCVQS